MELKELKEEDVVMCTVKRIEGTTVFVTIEGDGEGTMVISEVAAGRIRNLREYVLPNKKIVCKALKIDADGHIHLSLRRVTGKERELLQEEYKKERTFTSLLGTVLKDTVAVHKMIEKIKETYKLANFFDIIRSQTSLLEQFMKKEEAERIASMIAEKEEREKGAKRRFILKTTAEQGLNDIKSILVVPGVDIRYLGSAQFSISAKGADFKEANAKVATALAEIEKRTKEKRAYFEVREK